jgi:hypothetical protein
MPLSRQTRSQTTIHTQDISNAPLPPRVVTPRTLHPSPPRVPTRSQRLSPRNLSENDFCRMDTAHMAIALVDNHWSRQHLTNAVIHPTTGKEMEYTALMKDPQLQPLWKRGFGNECELLFQGIWDIAGTDTCFFIKLTNFPKDRKITYGKIGCDYKPHKKEKERLLRRHRHFNSRHNNIQNPNQQHPLHRGRRHDDDGHKELLSRHPAATI